MGFSFHRREERHYNGCTQTASCPAKDYHKPGCAALAVKLVEWKAKRKAFEERGHR